MSRPVSGHAEHFPLLDNLPQANVSNRALEYGKAAEHLVCADLLLSGYSAFMSDAGCAYDVLVEARDRLWRIQVKSTLRPRNINSQGRVSNIAYSFNVRRRGKGGRAKRLDKAHCDIVALVALDIQVIAYFPVQTVAQTIYLYPPGYVFKGKYKRSRIVPIDRFPFQGALGC